jgi:hypothetical protein
MIPQYDIFRLQDDGTPVWLEPASTLDDAQNRVHQFGVSEQGEYLIFNQGSSAHAGGNEYATGATSTAAERQRQRSNSRRSIPF